MIKVCVEQGSEAWFQNRLGRITGTRFKALMSGKSTAGYKDLITDIAAEIVSGEIEETYTNSDMERGKELEPFARELYSKLLDVAVEEVGMCLRDEDDELYEWVGISPDGLTDGLLEIKCPKMKTHFKYIRENRLPVEYRWQVQGQLFVTGLSHCDFMSYHPSLKPFIIRVLPDENDHRMIHERLDETIPLIKLEIENYKKYNYEI